MSTINTLRQTLFETLEGIKSGKVSLEQARAINEISKTMVDTAKVEVEFLRVTDEKISNFIRPPGAHNVPLENGEMPNGITSITRHVMQG